MWAILFNWLGVHICLSLIGLVERRDKEGSGNLSVVIKSPIWGLMVKRVIVWFPVELVV